jgi:hypothetical protein
METKRHRPSVSPWQQLLPHFDWIAGPVGDEHFGDFREFVALACDSPALAGRFVFPSTVAMTIFREPDRVDYDTDPRPARFIVSPLGPATVRVSHLLAGAEEPVREGDVPPGEAIAIIAAEFGWPTCARTSRSPSPWATPWP